LQRFHPPHLLESQMMLEVAKTRLYVGFDSGVPLISRLPNDHSSWTGEWEEIVVEFDPGSYVEAVGGPGLCHVVIPDGHSMHALADDERHAFIERCVNAAWPTMELDTRIAHKRGLERGEQQAAARKWLRPRRRAA
jgi:hypothetical protein